MQKFYYRPIIRIEEIKGQFNNDILFICTYVSRKLIYIPSCITTCAMNNIGSISV